MKNLIEHFENNDCSEEAATSNSGNIKQAFKIDIHDGKGFYETGFNNTFWSNLIITAKIYQPQNGIWKIRIKDKARNNMIVYENHNVEHDKEISFNYKTGLKVNLIIEAIWSQRKDTILIAEISIKY